MMNKSVNRPARNEYVPDYEGYISLVPEGDLFQTLEKQLEETLALLRAIPEAQADSRYAPGKWSIKELVGHLIDSERIFAYRALRFSRKDETPLPGYEQDDYIRNAAFDKYNLADLASEFEHVRRSNLYMFRHLDEEAWQRRGNANDAEISVRALAYIIAGHGLHHVGILRTRYLASGQTA
jgi:hypothetical protein